LVLCGASMTNERRDDLQIDLDNPIDAKKFLRGIRIQGKEITVVTLESGRKLEIEAMTDAELVNYARELYIDVFNGESGGVMELETEHQDQ
jgi:hypothetical protein